jgi:hypothetical protein
MAIRVKDLKPQQRMIGNVIQPCPFLYCTACGEHFSADPDDYIFASNPNTVFAHCDMEMVLASERRPQILAF